MEEQADEADALIAVALVMAQRAEAIRALRRGAIWCASGALVSWATYASASDGGTYAVFWGAILWGALRIWNGARLYFGAQRQFREIAAKCGNADESTVVAALSRMVDDDAPDHVSAAAIYGSLKAAESAVSQSNSPHAEVGQVAVRSRQRHDVKKSVFSNGAVPITDMDTLSERTSLLAPELGLGQSGPIFQTRMTEAIGDESMQEWLDEARNSHVTLMLIRRFSKVEGNARNPGLKGQGRMGPESWPRLGGLLNRLGFVDETSSRDLIHAVERTVQASYLAALVCMDGITTQPRIAEPEAVWQRWIPEAYRSSEELLDVISAVCAFDPFWEQTLTRIGVPRQHTGFDGNPSDVVVSLGGLIGVGAVLAFAERQDDAASDC